MYIYVINFSVDFLAMAGEASQICAEFNKNNNILRQS